MITKQRVQLFFLTLVSVAFFAVLFAGNALGYGAAYSNYFTWYDNIYGRTWILGANPSTAPSGGIDVYLGTSYFGHGEIPSGVTTPMTFLGTLSGSVQVDTESSSTLVSERSLFGGSFEEIWSVRDNQLDSHYYWPIYDGITAEGMRNWILVSNPPSAPDTIAVEVRVHVPGGGDVVEQVVLPPGTSVTPEFEGLRSGPVEVKAWLSGGSWPADARDVIASQRVMFNGAFNEMPGIPEWQLSADWAWTWFDNASPGANAWICVGNPNAWPVYVLVTTGTSQMDVIGPIEPGSVAVISNDEPVIDGPILMHACGSPDPSTCLSQNENIYASQRSIWGPSFSEIAGVTDGGIGPNANWTWYDHLSGGSRNWVLMSNLNGFPIYGELKIGGAVRWSGWIASMASATPSFPGLMGGPVEAAFWTDETRTTPADVFASQRVLWAQLPGAAGYFNEIVGRGI